MVGEIDATAFIMPHEPEPEPEEVTEKEKSVSPFDFIKSVSNTKRDILKDDPEAIKNYNAYIVNKGLGYFPDTVLIANEMNMYPEIPNESQYYYYMGAIRKGKRFSKWFKPQKENDIELIQLIYNVRIEVAKQYRKLISDDDMKRLHEASDTGGISKKTKRNDK